MDISRCRLAGTSKKSTNVRAARAARLFPHSTNDYPLFPGVAVDVVIAETSR